MDSITSTTQANRLLSPPQSSSDPLSELASEDFLELLLTQITQQDPLEPTGNEELLRQISSIRDIELSSQLTETLKRLTGQQHFSAASAMIGQYVTGPLGDDGLSRSGVVTGARFETDGQAILILDSGREVPLEEVTAVESATRIGETLLGKHVSGQDRRDSTTPNDVAGIVTGVRGEADGIVLELDSGESLRLADVSAISDVDPAEIAEPSVGDKIAGGAAKFVRGLLGF